MGSQCDIRATREPDAPADLVPLHNMSSRTYTPGQDIATALSPTIKIHVRTENIFHLFSLHSGNATLVNTATDGCNNSNFPCQQHKPHPLLQYILLPLQQYLSYCLNPKWLKCSNCGQIKASGACGDPLFSHIFLINNSIPCEAVTTDKTATHIGTIFSCIVCQPIASTRPRTQANVYTSHNGTMLKPQSGSYA